jgi:hypothetical protein
MQEYLHIATTCVLFCTSLHEHEHMVMFRKLCAAAELEQLSVLAEIDASTRGFFSQKCIYNIFKWLVKLDWQVAFQVEAILRNGIFCHDHGEFSSEVLRCFEQTL